MSNGRSVSIASVIAGFMWVATVLWCAVGITIGLWHYGENWARTVGVVLIVVGFLHAFVAAMLTVRLVANRTKRAAIDEMTDVVIALDRVNRMEDRR